MMPDFKSNRREVEKRIKGWALHNLDNASLFLVREIRKATRPGGLAGFKTTHGSHGLSGSIGKKIDKRLMRARVGSGLVYARIHEQGGYIRPRRRKYLTIPVTPEARKAGFARNIQDLHFQKTAGGQPVLADSTGAVHFLLRRLVHIPARPYLRPTLKANKTGLERILLRPMPGQRGAGG